ncbi:hypothetical protein GA0115255_105583 [Streptomyces sp. Ncost-T6T-2b]|nr:hypothetical protein GA0115255_105583 [Streptomyces sp. Ncost-T6T-2b]
MRPTWTVTELPVATRSGRTPTSRAKPTRAASTASKLAGPHPAARGVLVGQGLDGGDRPRGSRPQLEVLR